MSQMGSTGLGSVGASPIQTIVTDAGSVTPNNGVVTINGSTNITTQELSNNVVVSLNNSISINRLIAGDIDIANNSITSQDGFDITLSPNSNGRVTLPYGQHYTNLSLDSNKNILSNVPMTNGQLLIGSSTGAPAAHTLTAGPGISITNDPGSITIANKGVGGGFKRWETLSYGGPSYTQRYNLEPNVGYIANSWYQYKRVTSRSQDWIKEPVIMTLPSNDQLSLGDMIIVNTLGGGGCIVNANQNQLVTWCSYRTGTYPNIYQIDSHGTVVIAPAFGYGWGIQPGNYPGTSSSAPYYDQPQSIWLILIDDNYQGQYKVFYIYKIYQYWYITPSL